MVYNRKGVITIERDDTNKGVGFLEVEGFVLGTRLKIS